jgi:hypothetical protein
MGAVPTRTRRRDVEGGLEVVRWHTGGYAVCRLGTARPQPVHISTIFPRKRNAVAFRRLLLAVHADWLKLPPGWAGRESTAPELLARVVGLIHLAEDEQARRLYRLCLCCGHIPSACACARPRREGEPRRYIVEDMAWAA